MLRVLDSIRWSEGFVSLRIIVFVCLFENERDEGCGNVRVYKAWKKIRNQIECTTMSRIA